MTPSAGRPRIMLLISPSSYRGEAFSRAARRLEIEPIPVFDMPDDLEPRQRFQHSLNFRDIPSAVRWISDFNDRQPLRAILSVDDSATELAAVASEQLGLPSNDPRAAQAARDKFVMRSILSEAGVKCPEFRIFRLGDDVGSLGGEISYPAVVKPRRLSGSRGVIRVDNSQELEDGIKRVEAILEGDTDAGSTVLIESYLPGGEVAVEGVVEGGNVQILAVFDKPDPLEGPFFEETIYVTPSRLPPHVQQRIHEETTAAAAALGLRNGPIHAEFRISDERAWLLEIAGRSIGGL
jgi:biotin carboxylase